MSLILDTQRLRANRVPRASGDEPRFVDMGRWTSRCSPRERG